MIFICSNLLARFLLLQEICILDCLLLVIALKQPMRKSKFLSIFPSFINLNSV